MADFNPTQSELAPYVHLRFLQATIYCEFVGHRLRLAGDPPYGEAFDCPACGQHVPAARVEAPDG